ncbi:MAG: RtcB family protein [Thermodesulfobacteriota bacterium]
MKKTVNTESIPIKLWLDDIDEETLEQAKNLANLPFAFHHIAIMPDAHVGYGMPIGGIMAAQDMVVPNAVGVDIGCGMCAQKTSITEITRDDLLSIMGMLRKSIPVGFKRHKKKQDKKLMPRPEEGFSLSHLPVVEQEYENARTQIGTLGGGNHFIEIQRGSDNYIWIMIHSGSRNLGFRVAHYYNKLAAKLNTEWNSEIPGNWQLAYLPIDSDPGRCYLQEMKFCVEFALANRKLMMERIREAFTLNFEKVEFGSFINIAHNYASLERHYQKKVIVHRKGATSANKGEMGIIPGSQGSNSYIVRGKGSQESFKSCSHGAGRKLGRKQAQRRLDLQEEKKKLNEMQIIHAIRNKDDLDEATSAYKDIDKVMANQKDLVDVVETLQPLGVIKG